MSNGNSKNSLNLEWESSFTKLAIVRLIDELNSEGIKPRINGIDLLSFGDDVEDLIHFIQRFSVVKNQEDIRRILQWKLNCAKDQIPLSSLKKETVELLYDVIFNQVRYLEKFSAQTSLEIVLFRRGRSGSELTNLLNTIPFINIKIIVSGTDDSESWYYAAREFNATGVPGAGKALLDLAQNRSVKEFLKMRITGRGQTDHEIAHNFNFLLHKLRKPTTKIRLSDEMDLIYKKAMRMPVKTRIELAEFLYVFSKTYFKHKRKANFSKFVYRNVPIRSLVIVGAYFVLCKKYRKKKNINIWQATLDKIGYLLELKKEDKVIFPTNERNHLISIIENGEDAVLCFSEAMISNDNFNYSFYGIWLINEVVDDKYIASFEKELLKNEGVVLEELPEHKGQIGKTSRKINFNDIGKVARFISKKSSSEGFEKISISSECLKAIENADLVLYSGAFPETHLGGALITPGLRKAIKSNKNLLKILFMEIEEHPIPYNSQSNPLDRIFRYVSGKMKFQESTHSWNNIDHYINYVVIGVLKEEPVTYYPYFDKIEDITKGTIGVIGLNTTKNKKLGFYSSAVLKEAVIALQGLNLVRFKISNQGQLMKKEFLLKKEEWSQSQLGLFRNNLEVKNLSREIIQYWSEIVTSGAFVFDVDMTILPKGGKFLTDYSGLAYLFMRILRDGVKVAIISGNSEKAQMKRIFKAIKAEMKDDQSALVNLTFYVNGGATKIKFDNRGKKLRDRDYNKENSMSRKDLEKAVNKALTQMGAINFGLKEKEIKLFISKAKKNYPHLKTPWLHDKKWIPSWLTIEEIDSLKSKKLTLNFPWVEIRGAIDNKKNVIASIAIRPTPKILKTEFPEILNRDIDKRGEIQKKIRMNLSNPSNFYIRSGGTSTTDISNNQVGKTKAIKDFISSNKLNQEWVFYLGDEFYERSEKLANGKEIKQKGNDEEIARDKELLKVRTLAINSDNMEGANSKTIWIGRSPQATLEFLEEILIKKAESKGQIPYKELEGISRL